MSAFMEITASVFQGSAIGPASFVVTASDLHTLQTGNRLVKYADDTYLIVPAVNTLTVEAEINHVTEWATVNNLQLNKTKTQEIVFTTKRSPRQPVLPELLPGIVRVQSMKVLGVWVDDRLSFKQHVKETITSCARALYALRVLKAHGLPQQPLYTVFKATVQSRLLDCSPAWAGFCSSADYSKLDSFLTLSKRLGFCDKDTLSIVDLFNQADQNLFNRVLSNDCHVLNPLLSPVTDYNYLLRPRPHNHKLVTKTSYFNDNNFIVRMLFKGSF